MDHGHAAPGMHFPRQDEEIVINCVAEEAPACAHPLLPMDQQDENLEPHIFSKFQTSSSEKPACGNYKLINSIVLIMYVFPFTVFNIRIRLDRSPMQMETFTGFPTFASLY